MSQTNTQIKRHSQRRIAKAMTIIAGAAAAVFLTVAQTTGQEAPATQPAGVHSAIVSRGTNSDGAVRILMNKSQVITTRVPYKRVSVAQPEIADVNTIAPQSILITAKKPGSTQIVIWDDADHSQVMDVVVVMQLQDLQDELNKSFTGAKIQAIEAGGAIALHGHVPSVQVAEQAMSLAQGYGKVLNFMEVSGGQQVLLQVRFAEVSRSATNQLGFAATAHDGTSTIGLLNGPVGDPIGAVADRAAVALGSGINIFGGGEIGSTAFEYFIQALRQNNLLRVLAEPNVTAISGQEASFLAGGEFPIPVPQASGGGTTITIEYKKFGIQLNFTPVVLGDGHIRLEVAPEVSDLDFSNAVVQGGFRIPALTTRTVHTHVELTEGQTFAIAGLLSNRVQSNKDVTPLLGDIPVLGALFRSVRYERHETELVVMVTPHLVEPMNPGEVPLLPGEKWRYPSEADLFWGQDLGGPADDRKAATTRPADAVAPRFHGQFGYMPATTAAATTTSSGE